MSELQQADAVEESTDYIIEEDKVPVETEATADSQNDEVSATSTEQAQEKKPEITPEAQKIIAEKAFKEREARREAEELRKRLEALEQQTAPQAPKLPSIPDRWDFDSDDDYQRAVNGYAEAMAERKAYELQERQKRQVEQQQVYQQQIEQRQKLEKVAKTYSERAKDYGISAEDLKRAGDMVAAYGMRDDVAEAILNDANGALITKYLASNPQAIDALNQSTWLNGQEVFGQVRQAAESLKPKTSSSAPPPPNLVKGGSVPTDDNPWGATIE